MIKILPETFFAHDLLVKQFIFDNLSELKTLEEYCSSYLNHVREYGIRTADKSRYALAINEILNFTDERIIQYQINDKNSGERYYGFIDKNSLKSFLSVINHCNQLLDSGYTETEAEALMKLIL